MPTIKDWPAAHQKLLRYILAITIFATLALIVGACPRVLRLKRLKQEVQEMRKAQKHGGVLLDEKMLSDYISDCNSLLDKSNGPMIGQTDMVMNRACGTFIQELKQIFKFDDEDDEDGLYIGKIAEKATRIDYKDLYDRVMSEFKAADLPFAQSALDPDVDNQEVPFHQIMRLLTVRELLRLLQENNLTLERNANGNVRVHAMRTCAYVLSEKEPPCLLEFPVIVRFTGTMDDFTKFASSLMAGKRFLPIKQLSIYSLPPAEFAPGDSKTVETLHFRIVASSFFK